MAERWTKYLPCCFPSTACGQIPTHFAPAHESSDDRSFGGSVVMADDILGADDLEELHSPSGKGVEAQPGGVTVRSQRSDVRAQLAPWQVKLAKQLMVAQLNPVVSLSDVADKMGLSVSHFIKGFTRSAGVPPYRWLMQKRIHRSVELLELEAMSIAQIATECGFADQSHFTRAFKNLIGMTPARWRREIKADAARRNRALEAVGRVVSVDAQ